MACCCVVDAVPGMRYNLVVPVKNAIESGSIKYFQQISEIDVIESVMFTKINTESILVYILRHKQIKIFKYLMQVGKWRYYADVILKENPKIIYQLAIEIMNPNIIKLLQHRLMVLEVITQEKCLQMQINLMSADLFRNSHLNQLIGKIILDYLDIYEEVLEQKKVL